MINYLYEQARIDKKSFLYKRFKQQLCDYIQRVPLWYLKSF